MTAQIRHILFVFDKKNGCKFALVSKNRKILYMINMENYKILNINNLKKNITKYASKKICAMVKANAYGHGLKEVVLAIKDYVDYFGVVSEKEGVEVRKLTDKPILICSKTTNLRLCKKYNLEVMIEDEEDIRKCIKFGLENNMHLKINCGMNRFGSASSLNLKIVNEVLKENNLELKSIYTHFPRSDLKRDTKKCYKRFQKLRREISQNPPICLGGSGAINYNFDYDILRLGIGMYGYGQKDLLPVMEVTSSVRKIFYAKKGEYIGYGKFYKARKNSPYAVVAVGYGDGLRRNLSGKFYVMINGKKYKSVGRICMDAFFVKIDKTVKVGDEVKVMQNAEYLAKKSGTISYEILTGFSNFRGKTILKDDENDLQN